MPPDPRPGPAEFRCDIAATPQAVRLALSEIRGALAPLSLSPEEAGGVELVLAEALNNIVEHAYADAPRGEIGISVSARCDGLHCRLHDTGQPMPDGGPPMGRPEVAGPVPCDLPEGGFGWFLIRELARELAYERRDDCNVLSFKIALRPHRVRPCSEAV